ncbi:indigoidine synthase A-like protein [Hymenopellis radicata]|nr:indigoidine synthase A-like protein [Hymenopellis radicata]
MLKLPQIGRAGSLISRIAHARSTPLDIHPEVQTAIQERKPVVALETTLVSHGFPYPTNYELATSLEDIVRSTGSIPATIGIIEGRVKVGMNRPELERLADKETYPGAVKVSRRDIGPVISAKMDGGTTCSATLIFAAMVGIKVFATGGLGGVHRGGESTMDVSADLFELSRCEVGLVSAGVKSILDIGRTLEYLETLGVPVVTYGPTRHFPAFFTRHSGFQVPYNVETPTAAASLLRTQWQFGMKNGALIAVPIPEEHQAIGSAIQQAVEQAIEESEANGISKQGKEATPWLLARVAELTGGDSLTANIALLKNTALVGGQIAVEYQNLADEKEISFTPEPQSPYARSVKRRPLNTSEPARLVIVGASAVDVTAKASMSSESSLAAHSTVPGSVELSLGGVARNFVSHLLLSPIGDDSFGNLLLKETEALGMRTDGLIKTNGMRTAVCNMLLSNDGHLITGVADMDITAQFSGDAVIEQLEKHNPNLVAFDGNLSPSTTETLINYCNEKGLRTFFEPTSITKSTVILPAISSLITFARGSPITFASPNMLELQQMYEAAREEPLDLFSKPLWWTLIDNLALGSEYRMDLEKLARHSVLASNNSKGDLSFLVDKGVVSMAVNLLPFIQHIIIKCGELGVVVVMHVPEIADSGWRKSDLGERYIVADGNAGHGLVVAHFPPHEVGNGMIRNVTGAGDTFVGALLHSLHNDTATSHPSFTRMIKLAQEAAVLTLQSDRAVSTELPQAKA